jgi:hypothetical protein
MSCSAERQEVAMTEPDGESELDRALNALKPIDSPADTSSVVTPGTDPRMAWDTIIDREPDDAPPDAATPKSPALSFQFDLGGAMTGKLEPSAAAPATPPATPVEVPPLDVRRPAETTSPAVARTPEEAASSLPTILPPLVVPPLETRRPAAPMPTEPMPAEPMPTRQTNPLTVDAVVAPPLDVRRPAQATPGAVPLERRATPDNRDQEAPRRTVFDDEASGAARAALHRVPTGSSIAEAAGVKAQLPSLPTAAPATPSAVPFEPAVAAAPTVSDVRAYRTAQQRAAKRNGPGRLIGRMLLVIIILGAVIGAALMFGRSYLFPTEWDPALTAIVDDIQVARGEDFVEPIDLVVQPEAEFAATFAAMFIPGGWEDQLPAWRALGIAGGEPTPESVAASVMSAQPALFDPASEVIVQLADADEDDVEAALRVALEQGFDFQQGNITAAAAVESPSGTNAQGFLGVSDHEALVDRSLAIALGTGVALPAADGATLPAAADVPLPVAYELAAMARIGPAVAEASADAGVILAPGGDFPASVYSVFAPPGPIAPLGASLAEGETLSAPAVALSSDDWRLVLGARVSPGVADAVVEALTANSYATFDRAGTACFAAVFQFGDAASAQAGIDGVGAWVAALPVGSQAVATPVDFTTLQVVGCDPGTAEPIAVDASWADTVIDGQLTRL